MTKITAIHGGGDWTDTSVVHIILPEGVVFEEEKAKWQKWYREEYVPAVEQYKKPTYVSLLDWLRKLGATDPTPDQLEIVWDE